MITSESIDKITPALISAKLEMSPLIKNSTNPHFKSKYSDLSGVFETCEPSLLKHEILVVQSESRYDGGVNTITRLIHTSGQFIETYCYIDVTAKTPQASCGTKTYGRRYGLMAACGLAPVDDDGETAMQREHLLSPKQRTEIFENFKALETSDDAIVTATKKASGDRVTRVVELFEPEAEELLRLQKKKFAANERD